MFQFSTERRFKMLFHVSKPDVSHKCPSRRRALEEPNEIFSVVFLRFFLYESGASSVNCKHLSQQKVNSEKESGQET